MVSGEGVICGGNGIWDCNEILSVRSTTMFLLPCLSVQRALLFLS